VRAPDSLRKLNRSRVIEASEFFNTIGRKQRFKLRHYRKAPAKAIAAAPERAARGNAM